MNQEPEEAFITGWRRASGPLARVARNSAYLALGGVVTSLITAAQAIVLARYLNTQGYGYLALVLAPGAIAYQLVDFRTWEISIRFLGDEIAVGAIEEALELVRGLVLLDLACGVMACAMIGAAGRLVGQFVLDDPNSARIIFLASLGLPATLIGAGAATGVLRLFDQFHAIAAKYGVLALLQLLATGVVVHADLGLGAVIAIHVLAQVGDASITLALASRQLETTVSELFPSPRTVLPALRRLREIRAFAAQSWLTGTIKGTSTQLDTVLLGGLASPAAVGTYRFALDLAGLLQKLGNPIQSAVLPVFVDNAARHKGMDDKSIALYATVALSLVVLPFVLVVVVLSRQIVSIAGGSSYDQAAFPLAVLGVGLGTHTILVWSRPLLVAQARIATSNTVALVGAAIGVGLLLTLAGKYGATGAAVASALRYAITSVVTAILALFPRTRAAGG